MSEPEMACLEDGSVDKGSRVRILVRGEQTAGRLALIELIESRGGGPPRHLHHWEDEVIYVLDGEVTFHQGDVRFAASAGSCVLLQRGFEHTWRVDSVEARLLVAVAPAGLEASYRDLSWSGTPIEQLVLVAARFGIEITGPPVT